MQPFADATALARLMPGRWSVKATNMPTWLSGERRDPAFEFRLVREHPLTLSDTVAYVDAEGRRTTKRGTNRWHGTGFTGRAGGLPGLFARSNWEVAGARQGLLVIRFGRSLVSPGGVDVVVGEGVDATHLRSVVAADPASFGLALEEFASLTWFDHVPPID
jgi:hypothetical protein